MVEGGGHIPYNKIEQVIKTTKILTDFAPLYVLGPIVIDIAPGYDHITSAIGGAIAGKCGTDFLCYTTPAEHLRHPDLEDVKQGIITSKITAHTADLSRGIKSAIKLNQEMLEV